MRTARAVLLLLLVVFVVAGCGSLEFRPSDPTDTAWTLAPSDQFVRHGPDVDLHFGGNGFRPEGEFPLGGKLSNLAREPLRLTIRHVGTPEGAPAVVGKRFVLSVGWVPVLDGVGWDVTDWGDGIWLGADRPSTSATDLQIGDTATYDIEISRAGVPEVLRVRMAVAWRAKEFSEYCRDVVLVPFVIVLYPVFAVAHTLAALFDSGS